MTRLPAIALALSLVPCVAHAEGKQIMPPYGYIGLCVRDNAECAGGTDVLHTVALTNEKRMELERVNDWVNRNIPEYSDEALYGRSEYWAIATERGGDCEDLALLKQKLLMARGWPMDALLLAVVKEWNGAGHAVLIVITDQGPAVLDNMDWRIRPWTDAGYTLVKRQTRYRPYVWTNAEPNTTPVINYQPVNAEPPFLKAARRMAEITKEMNR